MRISTALVAVAIAQSSAHAANPEWTWFEAGTEIHDVALSPDGRDLAIVRQKRGGEPEVAILNIRSKRLERVGSGWSPAFSPDGSKVAYARQLKPMSGPRALAETLAGNDIALFDRATRTSRTLATPNTGYLSAPVFDPAGLGVVYSLSAAVKGGLGGDVGLARAFVDAAAPVTIYPPNRDRRGRYQILGERKFIAGRLIVRRSTPASGDASAADSYVEDLMEMAPVHRVVYSWGLYDTSSRPPMNFGEGPAGDIRVFDSGWRSVDHPASEGDSRPGMLSPDGFAIVRVPAADAFLRDPRAPAEVMIRNFESQTTISNVKLKGRVRRAVWAPDSRRLAVIVSVYGDRDASFSHDLLAIVKATR